MPTSRDLKAKFYHAWRNLSDTEVYFGAGDFAAACLTAEFFGIAINGLAFVVAVAGRVYESWCGRKPLGLGFLAMGVVSGITTVSIIANGLQKFGADFFAVHQIAVLELWFGAGAFAAWTIANAIAGYRKAHPSASNTPAVNHQTYFCLGSILATHAKPLPLLFFIAGIVRIFAAPSTRENPGTWIMFYRKHATPQRLRGIAYACSAVMAMAAGSVYVVPYIFWMLGNLVFDNGTLDKTFKQDFAALFRRTTAEQASVEL